MHNFGLEIVTESTKQKSLFCYSYSQQDVPQTSPMLVATNMPTKEPMSKLDLYLEQCRMQVVNISCCYRKTNHWFLINNPKHIDAKLAEQVIEQLVEDFKKRGRKCTVLSLDEIKRHLERDTFSISPINRPIYDAITDKSVIDLRKLPYGVLSTQLLADSHIHLMFFNGSKIESAPHQLVVKTFLLFILGTSSLAKDKVNVDLTDYITAMQKELIPSS